MKKLLLTAVLVLASFALCAKDEKPTMSLADARSKIGACISDPATMTKTIKALSAEDQKDLVSAVNEAIVSMPGSNEQKSATFLTVNRAALKGAAKGNLKALVAEVFATVPPEVLTLLNESFAKDLFSRTEGSGKRINDAQFEKLSLDLMATVNERMSSLDNGAARATFVILMLERASGGTPDTLRETLVKTLPEVSQDMARRDWIPPALADGVRQTYEPILGAADALGTMADNGVVLRMVSTELLQSMLGDLVEGVPTVNNSARPEMAPFTPTEAYTDPGLPPPVEPGKIEYEEVDEPKGYQDQTCNCWVPIK